MSTVSIPHDKDVATDKSSELEKVLEAERERYVRCSSFLFMLNRFKNEKEQPFDEMIEMHMRACESYYLEYGTIEGEHSPFLPAYNQIVT